MTVPLAVVGACTQPCLWVCPSRGCARDGLHSARLKLCCSVPCCLLPPLLGPLYLCDLTSGPLFLSLSFNSPLRHLCMEHPKSDQLTNLALFPVPSCLVPSSYWMSPGVSGLSQCSAHTPGQLVAHKCQQRLPGSLIHWEMQRGASSTGTRCLLPEAKPGSPLLPPHRPLPLMTSAHPNVHPCCGHVLHWSTLL